ncbi:uncharacterized protein KY384_000918 [Bacidia gigantensis]|uniref:uncharacterized protein n=1 Tax=Bacidia gigantensis TaxID=2732470 RepID=UPI001D04F41F|nr:uncharacterized protein KY384_000918 [Bacidia gigantensis]KAG8534075.1 hypothetical protein KY384_000918 [Bacidia gigantensis]
MDCHLSVRQYIAFCDCFSPSGAAYQHVKVKLCVRLAQALSNNSVTDFLILEYNSEIGGRCRHASFGKDKNGNPYTVELGANWIQGTQSPGRPANPIWTLVSICTLRKTRLDSSIIQSQKYQVKNNFSDDASIETFDTSGPVDYTYKLKEYETAYRKVEQDAGHIISDNLHDRSLRAALRDAGWDATGDPQAEAVEYYELDTDYAQISKLSSEEFDVANENSSFHGFSEVNNLVIDPRGFNAFLHGQASEFLKPNDSRLLLNKIVTKITYDNSGVIIQNSDGTCIAADYAITTFSVGVLKSNHVKFSPALPDWKNTAIQTFEMGVYTKIFLQFPLDKVFWNTSTQFFLYASPNTGYYTEWASLDHEDFFPGSGILFVTVTTDLSLIVDKQDDKTTKQQVLIVLRQMFGKENVPEPLDFMYPRWSLTPWAYGSYSNWPPGMTLEGHQNLRANVGRVWFAGEATSAEFYGYLQGGYFSGQDTGERVAACVNGAYARCQEEIHYEKLNATSGGSDEFGPQNGWFNRSFQTTGDTADS